jgi:adenosylcobinamide kinase/adenosylcobinamide-phosphate guanylyltransferase
MKESKANFIIVSNEVGLGLVPTTPIGRAYRDILGMANQMLARNADEVYLMVAGIPVVLQGAHSK